MQFVIDKLNGIYQNDTTYKTDDDSTPRRYEVTTSRDTHKTCQHTVQGQRERRFAILEPGEEHRGRTTSGSGEVRGQEHMRDRDAVHLTRGSELRTRVETKPSEPEDEHTQRCEGQ